MLAQGKLRVLSHSSSCLPTAHVAPQCNSTPKPENSLGEGRFHSIIYRDAAFMQFEGPMDDPTFARANVSPVVTLLKKVVR
jgi:hypothetical protein